MKLIIRALGVLIALAIVVVAGQMFRQVQAANAVERAWQTTQVQRLDNLGTTRTLVILPLVDEATSRSDLHSEHGVAYLIKTDQHTLLFDLGANVAATDPSPFQENMQRLGVTLQDIEAITFSHVHPDHVGGVRWWLKDTFALGNQQADLGDRQVYTPAPLSYPGLTPIVATEPTVIVDGIATTGALPFADILPLSLWRPVRSEQALAINVEGHGIVLVVGCGHPTVERLVARAQEAFGAPIVGVVGGLHYENKTAEQVQAGITFLRQLQPQLVALSPHDSTAANIQAFRDAFPEAYQEVTVGQAITLGQ